MYGQVVLLNADYTLLNAISWKRALCLMIKGKVDVVRTTEQRIGSFTLPRILRLIKRVETIYRRRVSWSKGNVLWRDRHTCQYCGKRIERKALTVDHVIPRSRGGKNTWTNTVAACFDCNNRKADRTPEEAGMPLLSNPRQPNIYELILRRIPAVDLSDPAPPHPAACG